MLCDGYCGTACHPFCLGLDGVRNVYSSYPSNTCEQELYHSLEHRYLKEIMVLL